jgi:type VI secretion system secreted protein Hcp
MRWERTQSSIAISTLVDPNQAASAATAQHCHVYQPTERDMAIDAYLQIEGIKGESQDDKHKDWIECTSVHFGINQPRSATASTGGGHTAERAELEDITFSKLADLSTPILLQHCAMGKTIPKAKFEFLRADGDGARVKYFEIELENVLIGAIHPALDAGSIMHEQVGLKFSKVKWKYSQQRISGGAGGNTAGGWDLAANKIA